MSPRSDPGLYSRIAKPNEPLDPKLDGVNGILEAYAGEKLVRKFIQVDKLATATATATATTDEVARPYRFGYGVPDENLDGVKNNGEKRVYFEFSDHSTDYIFYESPR